MRGRNERQCQCRQFERLEPIPTTALSDMRDRAGGACIANSDASGNAARASEAAEYGANASELSVGFLQIVPHLGQFVGLGGERS